MRYLKVILPAIAALALLLLPLQTILTSGAEAATIPTFSIVGVVEDQVVTIKTSNFPSNKTWTVRMGPFGTRAVNGTVVGTTFSENGGSFQATYNIPDGMKGASRIAIRMEASSGNWFAYNWFDNTTSGSAATNTPGPSPTPKATSISGYSGIPTLDIIGVVEDTSVTIRANNFPPNKKWTARMGPFGTRAINGTIVGTVESAAGGKFEVLLDIPSKMKGAALIAIRLDSTTGAYFAYNWFDNVTGGVLATSTPGPTPTTGPSPTPKPTSTTGSGSVPTFTIVGVVKDKSVTIKTSNIPANKTWTARMGKFGTKAVGGVVVGTAESGKGGTLTLTFDIPASLSGLKQIAVRLDSTSGGFFAYNWFYNNTYP
jgi:hypothetical protein